MQSTKGEVPKGVITGFDCGHVGSDVSATARGSAAEAAAVSTTATNADNHFTPESLARLGRGGRGG
ncbi:hypothetical protein, partial [Mycolicibacterium vinylchloridicum]|uniref:hypothetical protein n=1 Tax=Mycolicibacterium vinylchloridicum TaxID=2736928 RepID=UPI001F2E9770